MITLSAKTRKEIGKKNRLARLSAAVPAVIYGYNLSKNDIISVDEKEFKKVFKEAGENSLVEILIDDGKPAHATAGGEKRTVLVHDLQKDPISGQVIHIDFFQPNLKEEVEVDIPLIFEGVALAEKDLGGTLNKNMLEVMVKALPQNLPHEIKVDISLLKTFEDHILIKDLLLPSNVEVLKKPEEIVASVLPPQKVDEDLAVPIEENVEDVEKIVKEKKSEEVIEEPVK